MIQFSINGNSNKQVLQVCLKSTNEDGVIVNYMHKHAENIRNIYKWKFYDVMLRTVDLTACFMTPMEITREKMVRNWNVVFTLNKWPVKC